MTEMQIYKGKHECGKEMVFRIVQVNVEENNPKSQTIAWLIHSVCEKCKLVIIQGMFAQEEQPTQDVDYTIDYKQTVRDKNTITTKDIKKEVYGQNDSNV